MSQQNMDSNNPNFGKKTSSRKSSKSQKTPISQRNPNPNFQINSNISINPQFQDYPIVPQFHMSSGSMEGASFSNFSPNTTFSHYVSSGSPTPQ